MLTNQGFAQKEFRVGPRLHSTGRVDDDGRRVCVATVCPTLVRAWHWCRRSCRVSSIGVPIGVLVDPAVCLADAFRRLCMSFDAWIVGFGLSTLLRELRWVTG